MMNEQTFNDLLRATFNMNTKDDSCFSFQHSLFDIHDVVEKAHFSRIPNA